jgi:hypothetical protein
MPAEHILIILWEEPGRVAVGETEGQRRAGIESLGTVQITEGRRKW